MIRARFQIQSINALKTSLLSLGSDLMVTNDKPQDVIPYLIAPDKLNIIAYQQEITKEEREDESAIEEQLKKLRKEDKKLDVRTEKFWG